MCIRNYDLIDLGEEGDKPCSGVLQNQNPLLLMEWNVLFQSRLD
jgi:hypothetical protein